MISAEDWWNVFVKYNETLYPFQFIVMAIMMGLTFWVFSKPSKLSNRIMMLFLSLSSLWTGVLFFIVIGTGLPSPLRFIQGGLFVVIGAFLGVDMFLERTTIVMPKKKWQKATTLFLLIVVFMYPIFGLLRGHTLTQLVYPGTLPCATTSFALVMLSTSLPKTNKITYVLLLIWAITFAPLIQIPIFKVYEDIIMFVCGVYAIIILLMSRTKKETSSIL